MKLSQTKRAINAREWRVGYREKRRFNTLLNGYISVKYEAIYKECREFYHSLNQIYPERNDLTKTKDYKRWKKHQLTAQMTTAESTESGEDNNDDMEPTTSAMTTRTATTNETVEDNDEDMEPTTSATTTRTATTNETVEDNDEDEDNNSTQSSVEQNLPHEPPQQNILEMAAEEVLPANPVNVDDVDDIIAEIMHELHQDDVLRDILNNDDEFVQPHYVEEDEGIGLNVETELEGIIEPFDYALEIEDFDF